MIQTTQRVLMGKWFIAAALGFVTLLLGCSIFPRVDLAESANAEFQERLRLKHYSEIYAASAPAFRRTASLGQFASRLETISEKLSGCAPGTPGIKSAEWGSGGSVVTVNYMLHCANGELYEALSWKVDGGKYLLTSFAVSNAPFAVK